MVGEHLRAAVRSLWRRPGLTGVMVVLLGVGVGLFMIAQVGISAQRRIARPAYRGVYRVLADRAALSSREDGPWLPMHLDMLLFSRAEADSLRTRSDHLVATYRTSLPIRVGAEPAEPAAVRVTTRPLFDVFGRRFVAGGAWPQRADDDADARLAVITDAVARRWFGRTDVVGRDVDVDGVRFSIAGVVAYDEAQPYDLRFTPDGDELFIPWAQGSALGLGADLALPRGGFVHVSAAGDVSRLAAVARLMPCAELWDRAHIWDPGLFWISLLALAALGGCTFNLARLLLAKFIAEPRPASIRRALGARRRDVFVLHLSESIVVGALAAIVALGLAWVAAHAFNALLPSRPAQYRIDAPLVALDLGVAFVAALAAGVWPALIASRVAPATQLRNV